MNTKLLMMASSVFMGLIGIVLSFMPTEILDTLGQLPNELFALVLQLTGALYFGFAMTNWMSKTALIGGIYSRPLSIGNFSHFLIAGLALVKAALYSSTVPNYIIALTILYVVFALLFGYVVYTHPIKNKTK